MANCRATAALLVGGMLGVALVPLSAAQAEIQSSSIVIDANTGAVLSEQAADSPRHPASLTKMMTLFLAFDAIEQGRLAYDSKLTVSAAATAVAPSKLELKVGEEIELIDAIKALITKSANDMAVAIAERLGGSEAGFVRLMNERAHQIGMRSTVFTNASGLPDPRQITTARDMVTLGLRLQDEFPRHYRLFSLKSFDYRGKTYRTHNTLLYGFPGMDGIKTGYTRASGFNLVSSVHTEDKHVVAAVFGSVTAAARNAHMRLLLFRALQKASTEKTRQPAPQPAASPAPNGVETAEAKPVWKTETNQDIKVAVQAQRGSATTRRKPAPLSRKPNEMPIAAAASAAPAQAATASAAAPQELDILIGKVTSAEPASEPSPGAQPSQAPEPAPGAQAPLVTAPAAPRLDLQALREAMSAETAPETSALATVPAGPAAQPASIEALIGSPSFLSPPGRPPSTLESQAEALAAAQEVSTAARVAREPAPALRDGNGPASPSHVSALGPQSRLAAAPTGSGFEIQIGAYATSEEAESRMAAARSRAPGLLEGHASVTLPVQKGERQVFRARFTSFDESVASSACLELRRLAIDCFVMKAE